METQKGTSNRVISRRATLTPTQRLILAYLKENADEQGWTTASKVELAEGVECSLKTVDRAVQRLRQEGIIEVMTRVDEEGGSLANSYRVVGRDLPANKK